MENVELWMLIVIAILEVVDGQGIALRILRMLATLIGGTPDAKKVESKEVKS